jgi:tagatose 6-phosphate kinase
VVGTGSFGCQIILTQVQYVNHSQAHFPARTQAGRLILTVTLNAAVDKTYRVANFGLDRVHRTSEWRDAAGGKGINVARVHQTLGGRAVATGFLGGFNGRFIRAAVAAEGIEGHFVRTAEESRVCIAIVDPVTATQTEVNEVGPHVSPAEVAALKRRFEKLLRDRRFEVVTLSGSIPPGVPVDIYHDLIGAAHRQDVRVALDTSGEPLRIGYEARPWMLKPNAFELAALVGEVPADDPSVCEAAESLLGTGVEVVCVSQGKYGCVGVSATEAWKAVPPAIEFVSAVGSGDSFLGAFLYEMLRGGDFADCLRLAVGAGAANAAVYGSGFCTKQSICDLAGRAEMARM